MGFWVWNSSSSLSILIYASLYKCRCPIHSIYLYIYLYIYAFIYFLIIILYNMLESGLVFKCMCQKNLGCNFLTRKKKDLLRLHQLKTAAMIDFTGTFLCRWPTEWRLHHLRRSNGTDPSLSITLCVCVFVPRVCVVTIWPLSPSALAPFKDASG